MPTPVWLLDIDGVINATSRGDGRGAWPWTSFRRIRVDGFHLNIAVPVLAFLNRMHREGLAEIRWHTTWQEHALDVGDAFGLPTFRIADAPEFHNRRDNIPVHGGGQVDWWKLPAALRVVEQEKRPLLWTDDDAADGLNRHDWARIWVDGPGTAMVISPNPQAGLVQSDLDRIETFLKEHR